MVYYTTHQRTDGFGAQFQNIIFDIIYTEAHGDTYVFTPVESFEHNYTNDKFFTSNLNNFMNLQHLWPVPENINKSDIKLYDNITFTYDLIQTHIDFFIESESLKKIKDAFYKNKTNPYDTQYFNIAIHIRRHNWHDSRIEGTNTPDSWYLSAIQYILQNTKTNKPIKIHIFSQGNEDSFKCYEGENTVFHLNEDTETTFLHFVYSDILLTSRSSYSYCAALLTNAKVYTPSFWHAIPNTWTIIPH